MISGQFDPRCSLASQNICSALHHVQWNSYGALKKCFVWIFIVAQVAQWMNRLELEDRFSILYGFTEVIGQASVLVLSLALASEF